MDHRRIEWLFLIIFLLIDLYLGVEIWRSPVSLSNRGASEESGVMGIRAEMRADGIDLPAKLSQTPASGYYLAAKNRDCLSSKVSSLTSINANYNKATNSLTATPKIAVAVSGNHAAVLRQLEAFKNKPQNVPAGRQYRYEPNMSSTDNYTFVQSTAYGNIYDSDGQLTINIKNGQISNYTITYLSKVKRVRELQSTISPWHAIRAMYLNRELANNSRVTKIKLGYSELTEVRGSIILLPTWLVWVENKNTQTVSLKRVNAYTAQILQTNSTYSVEK